MIHNILIAKEKYNSFMWQMAVLVTQGQYINNQLHIPKQYADMYRWHYHKISNILETVDTSSVTLIYYYLLLPYFTS